MTFRTQGLAVMLALTPALAGVMPGSALGQEPRLVGRVPEPIRTQIDALLDSARAAGLPTEPLVDRALEGASKGAAGDRILAAARRLAGDLRAARDALGVRSSDAEIIAGASALRAGARPQSLAHLRTLRRDQPLTVAAAVLADLVAAGVPTDTAVAAVLALAEVTDDVEYIAFRRNVERDIALGASPVAALGVRLEAATEAFDATVRTQGTGRPRKP
ncbi:MAG: hypothetical protein GTN78_05980 [Gemmatimonadales bacterium]|nr:hypothetical protein [Gemmatimonadales bacterium]NIN13276.1 hypothetical protein [Gemmatimonadales bacterium]NIQ99737.1 hypothetical protein [Gemmatimonadales bacterium]NIS64234.1 hypothetical protein [Gemmatimonadales bacterium]